jgi:hypothetical protein
VGQRISIPLIGEPMTTILNASPTNGLVQTADGSGVLKCQSNGVTTNALAWVNFNGTGTVAIRSSYNVSSITDNGTGDYTVNFATALSDANYASLTSAGGSGIESAVAADGATARTTSLLRMYTLNSSGGLTDSAYISAAIFGN